MKITIPFTITNRKQAQRDLITQLVLQKDWNYWQKDGVPFLPAGVMQMALNNDRDFFIKLGKALYEGKHRKNALIDNFIYLNWYQAHYQKDSPPLKNFTPSAAIELLRIKLDREMTVDAYSKVIRRLGLRLKKRAKVQVCYQSKETIVTK